MTGRKWAALGAAVVTVGLAGLLAFKAEGGAREVGMTRAGVVGFSPTLEAYARLREAEFGSIDEHRRSTLDSIARFVRERAAAGEPARLLFVCTHNSRRSHMAQVWAQAAAARSGVDGVRTYSGGTEWTAFNPRAVAAIERAGFSVQRLSDDENPVYLVRWEAGATPMACFSKVSGDAPNPREGFAAVMVCSEADEACPFVAGAEARFSLPYDDPKASDGSEREAEAYDERCAQIAREMLYLFDRAGSAG